jgi:hypothetical protein
MSFYMHGPIPAKNCIFSRITQQYLWLIDGLLAYSYKDIFY